MTTFSDWLKSELLRLKSFDWQQGSWNTRSLPDGTMKFIALDDRQGSRSIAERGG
jgi:hypothetical protein